MEHGHTLVCANEHGGDLPVRMHGSFGTPPLQRLSGWGASSEPAFYDASGCVSSILYKSCTGGSGCPVLPVRKTRSASGYGMRDRVLSSTG